MNKYLIWAVLWVGLPVTICLLRGAPWERLTLLAVLCAFSAMSGSFVLREFPALQTAWFCILPFFAAWIWLMAFGVMPVWGA